MADKKFIRDLNSLIRNDERKRLKAPPERPEILGGVGISLMGEETVTVEYMYISHYGGGADNDIYRYDKDGGAPKLMFQYGSSLTPGASVAFDDYFKIDAFDTTAHVVKSGNSIIPPPLGNGHHATHVAATSTGLIVYGDIGSLNFYSYEGVYSHSVTPNQNYGGATFLYVNDEIAITFYDDFQVIISNHAGIQLALTTTDAGLQGFIAICRDAALIAVDHATNLTLGLFNNLGVQVATYDFGALSGLDPLGDRLSAIGMTSDRIYLVKSANSPSVSRVLIYEHTLTFTGNDVTGGALGVLLYTVNTPQSGDISVWSAWQNATMDAVLYR